MFVRVAIFSVVSVSFEVMLFRFVVRDDVGEIIVSGDFAVIQSWILVLL